MEYDLEGRSPFGQSRAEDRVAFIRNVYLWLMGGFVVAAIGAMSAPFVAAALIPALGRAFVWVLFGAQFGSLMWASAVSKRKPLNRYAYALFTYICGIFAGIIIKVVAQTSGPNIVLAAFGLTAADFLVLTAVAFVSKKDFSFLRSFVIVGITVMFFGSLLAAIFHLETFGLMISAVAVIACSAKILWDTSNMLRAGDFSDPAGFALSLFVSLYNIFISLLRLLGGRRD
jgi:FtsH-binding integral membrane protein